MQRCSRPRCSGEVVAYRASGGVCFKHSRIFSGKVQRPESMGPLPDYSRQYKPLRLAIPVLQTQRCIWLFCLKDDEDKKHWRACSRPMAVLDEDGQPLCKTHSRITI